MSQPSFQPRPSLAARCKGLACAVTIRVSYWLLQSEFARHLAECLTLEVGQRLHSSNFRTVRVAEGFCMEA
jgi:hypothetical protein